MPGLIRPVAERVRALRPAAVVEELDLLAHGPPAGEISLTTLTAQLRRRVVGRAAPVTLVAESLEAVVALSLAFAPPPELGAVVVHEPLTGPDEGLESTVLHATDQLRADRDPVHGAQRFMERMMGSITWAALPPAARGHVRDRAEALRELMPSVAGWRVHRRTPGATTLLSTGEGSAPMRHRAARTLAAAGCRRVVAGRGHLLSVGDPARLTELSLVAADVALANRAAAEAGHPSTRARGTGLAISSA